WRNSIGKWWRGKGTCTTHTAPSAEQAARAQPHGHGGGGRGEHLVERLHAGQMFGLGVLHGPRECPYAATVSLRAEASRVRLLVLTARSLFYLPDEEVDALKKVLEETDDPINVPPERLKAGEEDTGGSLEEQQARGSRMWQSGSVVAGPCVS
ncbi:unnamed protein product, partial [Prorocentrum cordatum]